MRIAVLIILLLGFLAGAESGKRFLHRLRHRIVAEVCQFLQARGFTDLSGVADNFAVRFHNQHAPGDGVVHLFRELIKEAQRHVDGRNSPRLAIFGNDHRAVGARLRARVILIRVCPGAVAGRRIQTRFIPDLFVVIRCRVGVPVGIHFELIAGVTRKEGAEFITPRLAFFRQRPDAAAKDVHILVLIHQRR